MAKRILKRWTPEDIAKVVDFCKESRTRIEKDEFAASLDRNWGTIYNKNWEQINPKKVQASKQKVIDARAEKKEIPSPPPTDITVTHINPPTFTTIKIGECRIETHSTKIRINNILIEL